jgi:iron(III) transport system ATP-binding protein
MYARPQTLFTAEFMGSNNRLAGRVAELKDGRARIEGEGWSLWGAAHGEAAAGRDAHAVIRLEQVRVASGPDGNRLRLPLSTSMFLGDKWEHLFRLGATPLRAFGPEELAPGDYWLEFPPERLWVF